MIDGWLRTWNLVSVKGRSWTSGGMLSESWSNELIDSTNVKFVSLMIKPSHSCATTGVENTARTTNKMLRSKRAAIIGGEGEGWRAWAGEDGQRMNEVAMIERICS